MKLRFYLALWVAKAGRVVLRLTGHNATDFPGMVALKLCPDFLKYVAKPEKIVAVTGTNGKTTTTNLLSDALDALDCHVLSNRLGSNIATGIASCLMTGVDLFNREKYPLAVLEVDERSSARIYPYVQPDILLCTNLARDSCFRNAHPHFIFDIIQSALPEKTKLVLNADDLISSALHTGGGRVYYTMDPQKSDRDGIFNLCNDMPICPRCQTTLQYHAVRYNHIGRAVCPRCGFHSPEGDIHATAFDTEKMTLTVADRVGEHTYPLLNDSIFNIYNELGAIAAMETLGVAPEAIARSLTGVQVTASRYIRQTVRGRTVISAMTKGWIAESCSAVFDYVSGLPGEKELVMDIEDADENAASSENLSFIYDADFEFLNRPDIRRIVIVGVRAKDFYLRCLMAGIPREKLRQVTDFADVPGCLSLSPEVDLYILYDMHQVETHKKILGHIVDRIEEVSAHEN